MVTNALAVYIKRGKVVANENGDFDDSEPINKSFIEKWSARKIEKIPETKVEGPPKKELRLIRAPKSEEEIQESTPVRSKKPVFEDEDLPEENEYAGLDAKKMATSIRKMEKEIEKLTLSNQKTRGQVVPIEPINSLFLQDRQSTLIEMKHGLEDILAIFGKRRDLTDFERTEIRVEFTDRLNEAMKRAAKMTATSVEAIVGEYSIKKSKGERE